MDTSFTSQREKMIESQIIGRGVRDKRVIEAVRKVPRHLFIPEKNRNLAYEDRPVSIGYGQTISQPYMVAYMTELLALTGAERVLEIGTGCGYQTAILGELAKEVYSIEIVNKLCEASYKTLHELNYKNINLKCSDGSFGWREYAPFDAIIVTAAPEKVPEALLEQLKVGGKLVIPVGRGNQNLYLYEKTKQDLNITNKMGVVFVPMTGKVRE